MSTDSPRLNGQTEYLKKGGLVLVVGIIGGYLADYGFNLLASRSLGTHEYGDYKVAYAFALMASLVVLLGGDRAAPKFLSAALANNNSSGVWEYLRMYCHIALVLSFVLIVLTSAGVFFHVGAKDVLDHHPVLLISFFVPVFAFGALVSRVLQAARHLAMANLPWRIGLPSLKLGLVLLISLVFGSVNLNTIIFVAGFVVFLISLWQWWKLRQLGLMPIQRQKGLYDLNSSLKISVPMMLAVLIGYAMARLDLLMLEVLGAEEQVGHYAAASVTAEIMLITQVAVVALFSPLIAPALKKSAEQARKLFWQGQKILTLLAFLWAVLLTLFGSALLKLFGEGFTDALVSLQLLVVAYLLWTLSAFSSIWLQYSGRGNTVVYITFATVLINFSVNFFLIPIYGMNGAATATLISMSFACVCICTANFRMQSLASEP